MVSDPRAAKIDLRQRVRAGRRQHAADGHGAAIAAHLRSAREELRLREPLTIAGFHPAAFEPDVLPALAEARQQGDRVLLPRTTSDTDLQWIDWVPGDLAPDRYGLLAPTGAPDPAAPACADLLLIPALAVDHLGTRLGQGAGYYDRALHGLARWPRGPLRVAVVHPWEVLAQPLPAQPHDVPMDAVLTAHAFALLHPA